jgi:hypothetical protein
MGYWILLHPVITVNKELLAEVPYPHGMVPTPSVNILKIIGIIHILLVLEHWILHHSVTTAHFGKKCLRIQLTWFDV